MKDGERERPIENYGKKEQKEWLDNTLPDPHPCTAGNKEEEHPHFKTSHVTEQTYGMTCSRIPRTRDQFIGD